jgi:hypothetical protein
VTAALTSFAGLQYLAFVYAGSVFQYPLDDPYIHMAIAEQMRAGGYGVNAGEYAAAASSVLFPVLLMPFAGEAAQRFMPLVWNTVGLGCAAFFWGRILWLSGYAGSFLGLCLAILGPIALHMVGLAFTGMEHALHLAASLAILLGLIHFLDRGQITAILIAAVCLAPILRFEGLALALLAAGLVALRGRIVAGLGLGALAVLPVLAFGLFLMSLGLDPMPSSISAKLATAPEYGGGFQDWVMSKLSGLALRPQQILAAFLLTALALFFVPAVRASHRVWLLGVVILAGGAHLVFAQFGWMDRYEIYILATVAAGTIAATHRSENMIARLLPVAAMGFAASFYVPSLVKLYPWRPLFIELQQAQMARFAKEVLKEPVAVNDIGLVAWRNPDYVLDLWGLASHSARTLRLAGTQPYWPEALTSDQGVRLAMVYEDWFRNGLGEDWHRLGTLRLPVGDSYEGGRVAFFLTDPIDPRPYVALLNVWQADLPKGASFVFAEGLDG